MTTTPQTGDQKMSTATLEPTATKSLLARIVLKVLMDAPAPMEGAVVAEKATNMARGVQHFHGGDKLLKRNPKTFRDEVPTKTVVSLLERLPEVVVAERSRRGNRRLWALAAKAEQWETRQNAEDERTREAYRKARERVKVEDIIDNFDEVVSVSVLQDDKAAAIFHTDILGTTDARKLAQSVYTHLVREIANHYIEKARKEAGQT